MAAVALVLLTRPLWQPNQSGAERANVLNLPVAVVGVLLTAASMWFAWKAVRITISPSPQEIASRLMKPSPWAGGIWAGTTCFTCET
jgi:hypothetical protein